MAPERTRRDPGPTTPGVFGVTHKQRTVAELEAALRVHAVAVALDAVDRGEWELDGNIIDGTIALLEAAARWQLVAELDRVA